MATDDAKRFPIVLVRHAEPVQLPPGTGSHWTDTELSDLGRRQAACVADRLAREIGSTPVRIVASDLKRAAQTAQAIAARLGASVETTGELREFNDGCGEVNPGDAIAAQAGRGETWAAFYARVNVCLARLAAEQDRLLIVVSHYGTAMNLVNGWLGLGLNEAGDIRVSFGSHLTGVSVLRVDRRGKHVLERLNDTSHLDAAGLGQSLGLSE
ncbi:MAG TPA: histidine phosphatase family protein [Phycisphaerae bacterium]|nr:histidine phosphatase family protein [Phycisphaerae bacterium]